MTFVGIIGILLGLLSSWVAFVRPTRTRVTVFVLAYLLQLATTIIFYKLVQAGGGDSALYYYDHVGYYEMGFGVNTSFIVYIVQSLKIILGGTYFDYFLLFQSFGFFGIVTLMRIIEEIYIDLDVEQPAYTYFILFLPSIHYWTSSIGKDGLFFLGTTLSIWAMMRLRDRIPAFAAAIVILFLVRPHIAMIAMAAFALTIIGDRSTRFSTRVILSAIALAGIGYAISTMRGAFNIDLANANVVGDMLAGREAMVQTESAGRTAVNAAYPVRVFSLLLRPLFFDAGGVLGLIVSFENALLLLALLVLGWRWRDVRRLMKTVPYVRFALLSSVAVLLLLGIGYYNVGLGLRQKVTMILPGILVAFVTLRALIEARSKRVATVDPVLGRQTLVLR